MPGNSTEAQRSPGSRSTPQPQSSTASMNPSCYYAAGAVRVGPKPCPNRLPSEGTSDAARRASYPERLGVAERRRGGVGRAGAAGRPVGQHPRRLGEAFRGSLGRSGFRRAHGADLARGHRAEPAGPAEFAAEGPAVRLRRHGSQGRRPAEAALALGAATGGRGQGTQARRSARQRDRRVAAPRLADGGRAGMGAAGLRVERLCRPRSGPAGGLHRAHQAPSHRRRAGATGGGVPGAGRPHHLRRPGFPGRPGGEFRAGRSCSTARRATARPRWPSASARSSPP